MVVVPRCHSVEAERQSRSRWSAVRKTAAGVAAGQQSSRLEEADSEDHPHKRRLGRHRAVVVAETVAEAVVIEAVVIAVVAVIGFVRIVRTIDVNKIRTFIVFAVVVVGVIRVIRVAVDRERVVVRVIGIIQIRIVAIVVIVANMLIILNIESKF